MLTFERVSASKAFVLFACGLLALGLQVAEEEDALERPTGKVGGLTKAMEKAQVLPLQGVF